MGCRLGSRWYNGHGVMVPHCTSHSIITSWNTYHINWHAQCLHEVTESWRGQIHKLCMSPYKYGYGMYPYPLWVWHHICWPAIYPYIIIFYKMLCSVVFHSGCVAQCQCWLEKWEYSHLHHWIVLSVMANHNCDQLIGFLLVSYLCKNLKIQRCYKKCKPWMSSI
jgi:hypothetical protein